MTKEFIMSKKRNGLAIISVSIFLFLMSYASVFDTGRLDREEAMEMFNYLQSLRQKKTAKSDPLNKYVKSKKPLLIWNDTLAKVAEARALDLAEKNYFDHIDKKGYGVNYYIEKAGYSLEKEWLNDRSNNFFESLEAGHENAHDVIETLIIDKGIPSKGHRKHLLGLDDWNEKNHDIGIAFYRVGEDSKADYSTYTVIIIARHNW